MYVPTCTFCSSRMFMYCKYWLVLQFDVDAASLEVSGIMMDESGWILMFWVPVSCVLYT